MSLIVGLSISHIGQVIGVTDYQLPTNKEFVTPHPKNTQYYSFFAP
jgi:hypothetical protein